MTHALGKDIPLGDKYSITIIMSIHKRVNFKASERTSERASERSGVIVLADQKGTRDGSGKRREEKEETSCGRIRGNEER